MFLVSLLIMPLIGIFLIPVANYFTIDINKYNILIKSIALFVSIINLFLSSLISIWYHYYHVYYQFLGKYDKITSFVVSLELDGLTIDSLTITTIMTLISLMSNLNWTSRSENIKSYLIITLLLETLLLAVFLVLNMLLFYTLFDSMSSLLCTYSFIIFSGWYIPYHLKNTIWQSKLRMPIVIDGREVDSIARTMINGEYYWVYFDFNSEIIRVSKVFYV